MLITIVIVLASLIAIAQVLLHINIKRLRSDLDLVDDHSQHTSDVLQGLALSNLTNTERMIITAAKQEAMLKHLGLKFSEQASLDDDDIVH